MEDANPKFIGVFSLLIICFLIGTLVWSSNNRNDPQHITFSLASVKNLEISSLEDTLDVVITDTVLIRPVANQLLNMRTIKVHANAYRESHYTVNFSINYNNGNGKHFTIYHHRFYNSFIRGHDSFKNDSLEIEIMKLVRAYGVPKSEKLEN